MRTDDRDRSRVGIVRETLALPVVDMLTAGTKVRRLRSTGRTLPRIHWPFALAMTVIVAIGANSVQEAVSDWHLHDMNVYRDAAERLIAGEPLYSGGDPLSAYRYAPWFAYAWVPLALLPDGLVNVGWSALMLAASAWVLWQLRGTSIEHIAVIAFFGPILFGISAIGNVQPLMVAGLMWGLSTRWGWIIVGLAASLKVAPIAFCAVFIARRQWWGVVGAVGLAGALWLPIVLYDVDPVTLDAGAASVVGWPWLGLVAAFVALWFAAKRSEWTGLASALAAVLALPRFFVYELTILLVPLHADDSVVDRAVGAEVSRRRVLRPQDREQPLG